MTKSIDLDLEVRELLGARAKTISEYVNLMDRPIIRIDTALDDPVQALCDMDYIAEGIFEQCYFLDKSYLYRLARLGVVPLVVWEGFIDSYVFTNELYNRKYPTTRHTRRPVRDETWARMQECAGISESEYWQSYERRQKILHAALSRPSTTTHQA